MNISKYYMIPKTERQVYFEFESSMWRHASVDFWFTFPFTHRGFELEFRIVWIKFGVRWELPF